MIRNDTTRKSERATQVIRLHPDLTDAEVCQVIKDTFGVSMSSATVSLARRKMAKTSQPTMIDALRAAKTLIKMMGRKRAKELLEIL